MSPAKRQQSDAMLYTLILFVGLFIAATTIAVIYYVKFEDQSTKAEKAERSLEEIATPSEVQDIGKIVGQKEINKSRLATMVDYLDKTARLIIGGVPKDTSAEVKIDTVNRSFRDTLTLAQSHINPEVIDPNTTGLVQIVQKLKTELDNTKGQLQTVDEQLTDLRSDFNNAKIETYNKERQLIADKEGYRLQVEKIKQDYNDLEKLLQQTSEERIQSLMAQLGEERANYDKEHQDKLQIQAQLDMTLDRMKRQEEELRAIIPLPDSEVVAHKIDGQVILVDDSAKVVHLNIGRA